MEYYFTVREVSWFAQSQRRKVRAKSILQKSCAYTHCQTNLHFLKHSFPECEENLSSCSFLFKSPSPIPFSSPIISFYKRNHRRMQCSPTSHPISQLCSTTIVERFTLYYHHLASSPCFQGSQSRQLTALPARVNSVWVNCSVVQVQHAPLNSFFSITSYTGDPYNFTEILLCKYFLKSDTLYSLEWFWLSLPNILMGPGTTAMIYGKVEIWQTELYMVPGPPLSCSSPFHRSQPSEGIYQALGWEKQQDGEIGVRRKKEKEDKRRGKQNFSVWKKKP